MDSVAERIFGQNDANVVVERVEKKFDTMMNMISQLLATMTQNPSGGHNQNQNTNDHNASTSNNLGGNGNASNHSSNNGGMPVGSMSRPLQSVFCNVPLS